MQYLRRLLNPDGDSGTEGTLASHIHVHVVYMPLLLLHVLIGSSSEEDEGGIDSAPPSRLNIVRSKTVTILKVCKFCIYFFLANRKPHRVWWQLS